MLEVMCIISFAISEGCSASADQAITCDKVAILARKFLIRRSCERSATPSIFLFYNNLTRIIKCKSNNESLKSCIIHNYI